MFTSKELVKKRIGLETNGFDNLIESLIESSTAYISRLCSTELLAKDYVEYYTSVPKLILRHGFINGDITVEIDGATLVKEDDYKVDNRLGIIYFLYPVGETVKDTKVSYNAGFTVDYDQVTGEPTSSDNLPSELRDLCETIVIRKFKKRESLGRDSESFDGSSVKWSEDISKDEKKMLRAFSRVNHSH